jgi:hypothetical protein
METNIQDVHVQAFSKLRKRVLPAVLDQNSTRNGLILKEYMVSKGYDLANMTDPDALATALYEAVNAEASRMKWLVLPKRLQVQQQKGVRKLSEAGTETAFADKVRKAAEAEANKKVQDAAQKATMEIIASFRLNSARKTEDFQAKLRARALRFSAQRSWKEAEADARRKIGELYTAAERENEYVGVYRNLLSEVEV